MQNFDQLKDLLATPKRIVITSHANPDGDALGSALGLYHYLKTQGHRLTVIMPTEMPDFLDWMTDYDQILAYPNTTMFSNQIIEKADIIFALDYNALNRIDQMGPVVKEAKAFKVMIDHHLYPEDFADAMLSEPPASSTCELIYDFVEMLGGLGDLSLDAMNALFVGMLTDTGGFRYATSPKLFRIVANLLEKGVDNNYLNDLVFNSYTIKRFELLAHSIHERIEILEDINTGIIALSKADHQEFNIQRGDTEGIVNFILRIRKLKCAIFVVERKGAVKISMRSKGDFSVQEICMKHFKGGGHKNASGATSELPFDETLVQIKAVLYNHYKEALVS